MQLEILEELGLGYLDFESDYSYAVMMLYDHD